MAASGQNKLVESKDVIQISNADLPSFEMLIMKTVAAMLEKLRTELDASPPAIPFKPTKFCCSSMPTLSFDDYMERFRKWGDAYYATTIIVLIYIARYKKIMEEKQDHKLCALELHRLIAAAYVLAQKVCSDTGFKNTLMAKIAGVPKAQMNRLELELLLLLKFDLHVKVETFNDCLKKVLEFHYGTKDEEAIKNTNDFYHKYKAIKGKFLIVNRSQMNKENISAAPNAFFPAPQKNITPKDPVIPLEIKP